MRRSNMSDHHKTQSTTTNQTHSQNWQKKTYCVNANLNNGSNKTK